MKKFLSVLLVFGCCVSLSGCGGSGGNTSVVDGADQSEVQDYEAMMAAEEEEMNEDPPVDE